MGIKSLVKNVLIEQQNRKYARLLATKAVDYHSWITAREQNCADACNPASGQQMDFVCIYVGEGQLAAGAMECMAQWFAKHPECEILYGDEDVLESGVRKSPWFKPDWSPDLIQDSFYLGSVVAIRKRLLEKMSREHVSGEALVRACVAEAGGYRKGSRAVQHVSRILFHGVSEEAQKTVGMSSECRSEFKAESKSQYMSRFEETQGTKPMANRQLSIVIPSKDNPEILKNCLEAIPAAAGELPYEVIIVDNGSNKKNQFIIKCMGLELQRTKGMAITYLYHPQEFNFSRMCNMGADATKGDLLLFLNDDVELAQTDSLKKLAELAVQEYTGAVGIKLYYPDSKRIQHAGITNLPMGPVHKLQFLEDHKDYYFGYNRGLRNVLAVTAACLMVEKEKFTEAGGFAEELRVAFNDVDFCFRLYELGYHNVCRNDCFAYHHESLSRGADESVEKLNRLLAERDKLYQRHPQLAGVDPYYNEGLGRDGLDTRICPAYETAGNAVQQPEGVLKTIETEGYRQDACLLFRVEDIREGKLQGYGVVLGDNNACYDRWLVLQRVRSEEEVAQADSVKEKESLPCYLVAVEGQYRPDLVKNLPDQINVGLCGVWVQLGASNLPAGQYRLGMAVRNRVTGLKLINWSNRTLEI